MLVKAITFSAFLTATLPVFSGTPSIQDADYFDSFNYHLEPEFRAEFPSIRPDDGKLMMICHKGKLWFEARYPAVESQPWEPVSGRLKLSGEYMPFEVGSIIRKKVKDVFQGKKILDRRIFFTAKGEKEALLRGMKKSRDAFLTLRFQGMVWSDLKMRYDLDGFKGHEAFKACLKE